MLKNTTKGTLLQGFSTGVVLLSNYEFLINIQGD